jgi:hypothetical protein
MLFINESEGMTNIATPPYLSPWSSSLQHNSSHYPASAYVSPASACPSASLSSASDHSVKRDRDDSHHIQLPLAPPAMSAAKRARSSEYRPAVKVPTTLISTMGTLAGCPQSVVMPMSAGGVSAAAAAMVGGGSSSPVTVAGGMPAVVVHSNLRVHLRRQLSGSKVEQFLGDHDAMDIESADVRPRSMSF